MTPQFEYPPLPTDAWDNTRLTLHLYLQLIGKVMLAMKIRRNHWWHMTYRFTPHGLSTGRIPYSKGFLSIEFDFVTHELVITSSSHDSVHIPLEDGMSVSAFYSKIFSTLGQMGIKPSIVGIPFDHYCKEPFATCETYHHYDKEYVERYWDVLSHISYLFEKFSAGFTGKISPVQLFWHHMDLAVQRFNGDTAPPMPAEARDSDKDAYSQELISAGFWAGDENVRGAALYAYTHPSPEGLENEDIEPAAAYWDMSSGTPMAMLMYDDIRDSQDPDGEVLRFLTSTYEAGAKRAKWKIQRLTYSIPA